MKHHLLDIHSQCNHELSTTSDDKNGSINSQTKMEDGFRSQLLTAEIFQGKGKSSVVY